MQERENKERATEVMVTIMRKQSPRQKQTVRVKVYLFDSKDRLQECYNVVLGGRYSFLTNPLVSNLMCQVDNMVDGPTVNLRQHPIPCQVLGLSQLHKNGILEQTLSSVDVGLGFPNILPHHFLIFTLAMFSLYIFVLPLVNVYLIIIQ